jgi:excisionase family DNA binding protein
LLTVREAAAILRLSPYTVYRYTQHGQIPHVKKDFGLRFKEDDLLAWINKDLVKPLAILPRSPCTARLLVSMRTPAKMAKSKPRKCYNFGFGKVYQRKYNGGMIRWAIDYKDPSGKRVQKVVPLATSKEEAYIALQEEVRRQFDSEYRVKQERDKIKFGRLAETYLEDYAKVNKKSWQDDKYRIDANLKPFFGDQELNSITPLIIERYRAERLKTRVTKSTVNRETTLMKTMFRLAIDWGLTDTNPVTKVRLFPEKDTLKERILRIEEEEPLLAACPAHLRPLVVVALHTGMRRGEILNLRWTQVDLEKGLIRVENTKAGKNRLIPVNDALLAAFRALQAAERPSGLVFANPRTGMPFTEVKKSFKSACRAAGIRDLRFHDLRHTFATRLIEAGADIITVKELLGHFSVRVTQRYTHPSQAQKRRAVDLLATKPIKEAGNQDNLLRSCDAVVTSEKDDPANRSFTIN